MLHAAPDALTHRESGIKHVRNDAGKALSRQAYYEATDPARMFVSVQQRNEKERTMIVEVHGMGFWTRVRFRQLHSMET